MRDIAVGVKKDFMQTMNKYRTSSMIETTRANNDVSTVKFAAKSASHKIPREI